MNNIHSLIKALSDEQIIEIVTYLGSELYHDNNETIIFGTQYRGGGSL